MVKSTTLACQTIQTNDDKKWPYDQYYIGDRDQEGRRSKQGENHWTGPESMEWYTGSFIRNTMHGFGDYRWRYKGRGHVAQTYEGHFYCNRMHGYGVISYADGCIFNGLSHNNMRWGPGVETQPCLLENVGLWRGGQLVRLAWRPPTHSVTLDLISLVNGRPAVEPHRVILTTRTNTLGKTNSALELLKQCGSEPKSASENWPKLYPKHCTDLASQMCHLEVFDRGYYKGNIFYLQETNECTEDIEDGIDSKESIPDVENYYAWNNNDMIVHMMKHCYKHEHQRAGAVDLKSVLCGPRHHFKQPGKHELNCRTLLMSSYLGEIVTVAQLINEFRIYPDVADVQGNTALMYAACGHQPNTVHFLVEAGANVNSLNDSCCTPLGMALIKLACTKRDIVNSAVIQAVLPPPVFPVPPPGDFKAKEWQMNRELSAIPSVIGSMQRTTSKLPRVMSFKKIKSSSSLRSIRDGSSHKRKETIVQKPNVESFEFLDEERKMYQNACNEFTIRVGDLFSIPSGVIAPPYLFEVMDMVKDMDIYDDDPKKTPVKDVKKNVSKNLKDATKPSKVMIWQSTEKDSSSIDSTEKQKQDLLARINLTILQLLEDGADPRLVRCPQPALVMAIASGCADLVRCISAYGADVNEVFPQFYGYTALDIVASRPFTYENLDLIRALLENDANANHRLPYCELDPNEPLNSVPGPNLLHIIVSKKTENEFEEEIRNQVINLLLEFNCNPMTQFKGRSALDLALSKEISLVDIIIKSPKTNLNAVINDLNQTLLLKMFCHPFCSGIPSTPRLQILTNLLLYGANPLRECQNGDDKYQNLFVFANETLTELDTIMASYAAGANKVDPKGKKLEKSKTQDKLTTKSSGKIKVDVTMDYKQAMDLIVECARLLHIRWLQAKLFKELFVIVNKFKHRQWNMILKELKNKKSTGLWLSASRCLEIHDIMKTTRNKKYDDSKALNHLLCIVHFCAKRAKIYYRWNPYISAEEKGTVESDVRDLLKDHEMVSKLAADVPWKRPYVMPELVVNADKEFNICFECALPSGEAKITCDFCKLVSFCGSECMRTNVERSGCHPCSAFLKIKYFPSPDDSIDF